MTGWRIDFDEALWVPVPFEFPDGPDATVEQWAEHRAAERRARGWGETAQSGPLEHLFLNLAAVAERQAAKGNLYVLLPDDAPAVLLVLVNIAPTGDRGELAEQLGAGDPAGYDRPQVTPLETPALGEGLRVLRYDTDGAGALTGTLAYGFRAEGADILVWTQADDPAALQLAVPFLDRFVQGIHPVAA
ncbi:MAG: hypothetical protein ACTHMS_15875 [Jatrophihabitans sp.]|uniref:hypothetical protein n=1 Tax=Jatrophihabitans sp. TaxID=1932789 RepID=UPI003F7F7288